ncbi:MAG: serine hydrolase [Cyanobacteria bacterium J06623_1]
MNRKGKKSSLTRAKNTKANSKSKNKPQNKPQGNTAKQKQSLKSKSKKVKPKAIAENSSRLQQNLTKPHPPRRSSARANQNQAKPYRTLKLATYAIAITIGLSTIFGSLVSLASSFQTTTTAKQPKTAVKSQNKAKLNSLLAIATLGKEITPLKISLEKLTEQYPDLDPEVFLVDLDTKGFVSLNGKQAIASASTIKLPILVAFLQDVDRGTVRLEEKLVMTKDVIAGGSGNMQHEAPGTRFSALETATRMMTISDNTATNMLIKRLGGMKQLNERFSKMGLNTTQLSNLLPDLTGTNTTSSADLGNLLVKIDGGKLISLRSRDRLLYIMRQVVKDTLLPQGLESGAIIAHKTGDIKSVLADVGIIDMPSGKRYIASILVKRPDNSPQAQEFIQKASRTAYQYFKTPQTTSFTLKDES